jgi:hypothetical protein
MKLEKTLQQTEVKGRCDLAGTATDFFDGMGLQAYCPYLTLDSVVAVDCPVLMSVNMGDNHFTCGYTHGSGKVGPERTIFGYEIDQFIANRH